MSERKKKRVSLIANLIIMIGLGISILTALQVIFLSELAKKDSRADNISKYVLLTTTINNSLEGSITGYFNRLDAFINTEVMKSGRIEVAGKWLQANPQIKGNNFDYVMLAGPDGYSYNDNGTRTHIEERDYFQAIMFKGAKQYIDNPVISKTTG